MHLSYGLQGSLKRRYKHPSLLPSMGTTRQKSSCRNGLQNGPRLLSRVKAGTHSPSLKKSHTAAYTPKQGPSGRGRYHYPRSVPHVHKHPRAGYQNGKLCRFWVLVGGTPEGHREPSEQRCAYARRCSEGVAAPMGCVIFLLLSKLRLVRPALRAFPRVRDEGGYHDPQRALRAAETPDGRLSKRLICHFLRSADIIGSSGAKCA